MPGSDILGQFIKRQNITARQALVAGIIILTIIEHTLVPIIGHYKNPFHNGIAFFLNFFVSFFQAGFLTPIGYATYIWTIDAPSDFLNMFISLNKRRRQISTRQLLAWYNNYSADLSKKRNLYIVLILVGLFLIPQTYTYLYSEPEPWFGRGHSLHFVFLTLASILSYYMLWWIIVREILAVIWIRSFFQKFSGKITLVPSHPDKCAGLGTIGSHASKFGVFMILLGLTFAFQVFVTLVYGVIVSIYAIFQFLGIILFLFVVYYSFYSLLIPAHKEMLNYKSRALNTLALEIDSYTSKIVTHEKVEEIANHVEPLEKLYNHVQNQYPTWPIKPITLRGITFTTFIEILSLVVSIIGLIYAPIR